MSTSFNEQFDQHGAWRREFGLRLKLLAEIEKRFGPEIARLVENVGVT